MRWLVSMIVKTVEQMAGQTQIHKRTGKSKGLGMTGDLSVPTMVTARLNLGSAQDR